MKAIDEFVPEENYSNGYELYYPLMDFEDLKVRPLVEGLLIKEKVEKEVERLEKEALQRKLRDDGLDDDGDNDYGQS